jgi:hypothetical protein
MLRLSSAFVMAALAFATLALAIPSAGLAKGGSYQHKDPIKASMLPSLPSLPSVSASESFNGCGGRRVRDPHTGQCRGPGDIGH